MNDEAEILVSILDNQW